VPVPRVGRRLPRPISEADLFTALRQAPPRIRPLLVLAAWAGLRAKEIARLRRQHVLDTARPPVLLVVHDATKGRSERIVPLSDFVLGELRLHGLPASGWMFSRHDGAPGPNTPHMISLLCNQHLHDCGIAATLHQLRHRFGTVAYAASHDLRMVQELLGHADPQTTALYTAYDQADAARVVQALPSPSRLAAVG
jgi:integrase